MRYEDEFLVHPRPGPLLALPVPELQAELVRLLDGQATATRADFDVLFGAGQIAFRRRVPGMEITLHDWLLGRPDEGRRYDIVACFLMGYWRGRDAVPEDLVDDLLRGLDLLGSRPGASDALIEALAIAHPRIGPSTQARRVAARFAALRQGPPGQQAYQASVQASLDAVLGPVAVPS